MLCTIMHITELERKFLSSSVMQTYIYIYVFSIIAPLMTRYIDGKSMNTYVLYIIIIIIIIIFIRRKLYIYISCELLNSLYYCFL